MQANLYDLLGLLFILGSAFFFYRTIEFLAQADYVAGFMALIAAFLVVRAGVDISRLALVSRRDTKS